MKVSNLASLHAELLTLRLLFMLCLSAFEDGLRYIAVLPCRHCAVVEIVCLDVKLYAVCLLLQLVWRVYLVLHDIDDDHRHALTYHVYLLRCTPREVYDAAAAERSAVYHLHYHRFSVARVRHFQARAERMCPVCTHQTVVVQARSACRPRASRAFGVECRHAFLLLALPGTLMLRSLFLLCAAAILASLDRKEDELHGK